MKKLINRTISIATSTKGQAMYLLLFFLIVVVLLVPAIVMDLSAYYCAKTHLGNVLDTASTYALANSTQDLYRSDKILYIITEQSSPNSYAKQFKKVMLANFNIPETDPSVVFTESGTSANLQFKIPHMKILSYVINVDIKYTGNSNFNEHQEFDNNATRVTSDNTTTNIQNSSTNMDVGLKLTTQMNLPILSKVLGLWGAKTGDVPVDITLTDGVRGSRVHAKGVTGYFSDEAWIMWEQLP